MPATVTKQPQQTTQTEIHPQAPKKGFDPESIREFIKKQMEKNTTQH